MRSGTSFFDWTLFKKNVTRYWPIWASYLTIWMFILPLNMMMRGIYPFAEGEISETANANIVFAVIYGVISAMAVMSHLYSPRSANFFANLPIRREGMFITHYLAGLAFVIVPNLVITASSGVVLLCVSQVGNFGDELLIWLASSCGEYFFFYTFAVLCGLFAGHILALPAFYGIMNILAFTVYAMADVLMSHFYRGYTVIGSWEYDAVEWLTPAYKLGDISWQTNYFGSAHGPGKWCILTAYIVVAVIMAAAGLLLYRARRTESAGDVVAVRFMRPIFKYGVAVCTGVLLGYVSTAVLGDDSLPYTTVVWTALGCFGAQMILDKSFRVFKKWKGAVAVSAAMAALMAVMMFDLTGFDSWVPRLEDVKYVEVSGMGSISGVGDTADWSTMVFSEPDDIQNILDLHAIAVENSGGGDKGLSLTFTYHTRTGVREREYYFRIDTDKVSEPGSAANIIEGIYSDRELYWGLYGFDELEDFLASGGRISFMEYEIYNERTGDYPDTDYEYFANNSQLLISIYANQIKLWQAIKQDFAEGRICVRHVGQEYDQSRRSLSITWETTENGYYTQTRYIYITESSTHTLDALREILPMELDVQGFLGSDEG